MKGLIVLMIVMKPEGKVAYSSWYGMYVKGNKVGYSHIVVKPKERGYQVSELTYLQLATMGVKRELKAYSVFEVKERWELVKFTSSIESEGRKDLIRGRIIEEEGGGCRKREEEGLNLVVKTGGSVEEEMIKTPPPIYPVTVLPMLAHTFSYEEKLVQVFDPTLKSVYQAKCKLVKKEDSVIVFSAEMLGGVVFTFWVDTNQCMILQKQPMGIELRKEPKNVAINIGEEVPEVMALYGIQPETKINNPREVKFLKLIFKGGEVCGDPPRYLKFGDTLILQTIGPRVGKLLEEGKDKYLAHTPFIQCNSPKIKEIAKKLTEGTYDPWKRAAKLVKWVKDSINDIPTVGIPSALEVLNSREGDCGEHTVLFVALARAVGIPAEIVVGLAYVGDGFYYHAWAKIWAGRWVEVDPTFGQPIADATHIPLAEGGLKEQAKIMKMVDNIELKILEFK